MLGNFYIANSKVGAQARLNVPAPETLVAVSALRDLGATITQPRRQALNTFLKGEIEAGRWDKVKRFYLPVWGLAGPNALCLKTLTSGTFVGGVTHGAGFVQSDGTTGRMTMGASPAGLGMVSGDLHLAALIYTAPIRANETHLSAFSNTSAMVQVATASATTMRCVSLGFSGGSFMDFSLANYAAHRGIFIYTHQGVGTPRTVYKCVTSGASSQSSGSGEGAFASPAATLTAMADSRAVNLSTCAYGAWSAGLGLSPTDAPQYSQALKTLWETCTGLTLP